jgi:hypothetical protein
MIALTSEARIIPGGSRVSKPHAGHDPRFTLKETPTLGRDRLLRVNLPDPSVARYVPYLYG